MIALVTGASSGIGEATARRLAREPDATLVLVARRGDRLERLAGELGNASFVAVDLVEEDAPARVRAHLEAEHGGRLDLLVNNAGGAWNAPFAEGGWENVHKTMALNFDALVRLTEALLPLLRASAPSAVVNVGSTAGRVSRPRTGGYSAAKAAVAAWSDVLYLEEKPHGVHVGLVLPGFISTEGFPQRQLTSKPWLRWIVAKTSTGAEAIVDAGLNRRPERYTPRVYKLAAVLRIVAPRLVRRALGG